MTIKFIDLQEQYKTIKQEIDSALFKIIDNTQFIQGEDVKKFEEEFAQYIEVSHCVAVNSGTDALTLGIKALSLPADSEIIVPANTFIATSIAVTRNSHKPVFIDIDENDYGIDLNDLQRKINSRTNAIILVHLYGQADKINEVKKIIKKTGKKIYLIEDACQAHGAFYKNKRVGGFGVFSAFSFYPGKNLGAFGDGGILATNNSTIAKKIQLMREYGSIKKYYHDIEGTNSRLDTIQAAVLRIKLRYLESWIKKRQENAAYYTKLLKDIPEIKTPREFMERKNTYHLYVIRAKHRNKLLKYLQTNGIYAQIHYPIPLHIQKAYVHLNYKNGDLPNAEKIATEIISLPLYPELRKSQIDYICSHIKSFYEKKI